MRREAEIENEKQMDPENRETEFKSDQQKKGTVKGDRIINSSPK